MSPIIVAIANIIHNKVNDFYTVSTCLYLNPDQDLEIALQLRPNGG